MYNSKLVSREMHHLGTLTHLPGALGPGITAASATSLALLPQGAIGAAGMPAAPAGDNPWALLHVHVLPLFNGEPLRIPMCVVCPPAAAC